MTENSNCQRNSNRIQGVYCEYGLIFEGFIHSEYEKSILYKFRKDKESYISYQIKGIVADIKPSNFNEWQINEIRRLL